MRRILCVLLCVVGMSSSLLGAEFGFGRYYSDQMVLQRDKPNAVRGSAEAGAEVTVAFAGQEKKAKADEAGNWVVTLDPMPASDKPVPLTAVTSTGNQKAVIKNVLMGDVILFARQTTVDITLGRDAEGRAIARQHKSSPNYRAIVIKNIPAAHPQNDLASEATTGWQAVDETQALAMSGAAYLLGRDLANQAGVPVGIVDLNMGMHFPFSWLSRETIGAEHHEVKRFNRLVQNYENGEPFKKEHYKDNPVLHPFFPSAGYFATLHPLRRLGLKGVLLQLGNDYPYMFYEDLKKSGKQTDLEALRYAYKMTYQIRKDGFRMEELRIAQISGDWRTVFADEALPVAWIGPPSSDLWTYAVHNREMRELQRKRAVAEAATDTILPGMDNIPFSGQPQDEKLLAERSLKWVRAALYGDKDTLATGPFFDRFEGDGTEVVVHFTEGTAKGLTAAKGALDHFEVADVDANYVPAKAVIEGETIRLTCDEVARIFYVRYNYNEDPGQGLVNAAGLPAVPFSTENSGHQWFVRYKDDDLAEEYYLPANEWKNSKVTLINAKVEGLGYTHFSGWFGPIGIKGGPFGPNVGVKEIKEGSPAEGKLLVGDVIYSANGELLGDEEEMALATAITESEGKDGNLVLGVHRDGENMDVELTLQVMGRYSITSPWNCQKTERIVENAEKYIAARGAKSGWLQSDGLFMLGAGSPEYQWMVRRNAARFFKGDAKGNSWGLGYAAIYLSEYYLATGDKRALPKIKLLCDEIAAMQIKEDNRRNGGWYGRGVQPRKYPAMVHCGLSNMLGMSLARECGVDVDPEAFLRGLAYLERVGAPLGQIVYGDVFRTAPAPLNPGVMFAGKLKTENGKVALAAVLYDVLENKPAAHLNSLISTHSWYSTRDGHGGNFWNDFWTPLGAAVHGKSPYIHFMKNHRWYRECGRMFDGGLLQQDMVAGGTGLALVVPERRLRILGAAKSPFSPDAPECLAEALAAYDAFYYAQAQTVAEELLTSRGVSKSDHPTILRLIQETKRIQAGIASDLETIESLVNEGRLHEAGLILDTFKPIMPADDVGVAKASAQVKGGTARENDAQLYQTALQAGVVDDTGESEAESADDLKRIEEEKAAAAAAAEKARSWKCFTPRKGNGKRNPYPESFKLLPMGDPAMWRFTILEHRDNAPEGWMNPEFDDSDWIESTQAMSWHLNHIALFRTTFEVDDRSAFDRLKFDAWVFRQQDVAIYLNGELIGRINNIEGKTGRVDYPFKQAALDLLRDGENTVAIATRQNWRWGMLFMKVYNGGLDFLLYGRLAEDPVDD